VRNGEKRRRAFYAMRGYSDDAERCKFYRSAARTTVLYTRFGASGGQQRRIIEQRVYERCGNDGG